MRIATETPQNEMVLHPKEIQKGYKKESIDQPVARIVCFFY